MDPRDALMAAHFGGEERSHRDVLYRVAVRKSSVGQSSRLFWANALVATTVLKKVIKTAPVRTFTFSFLMDPDGPLGFRWPS
jgi:hypothetical protein